MPQEAVDTKGSDDFRKQLDKSAEDEIHQVPLNMKDRALAWETVKGLGRRCDWWTRHLHILQPLPMALAFVQEKTCGYLDLWFDGWGYCYFLMTSVCTQISSS